MEKLPVSVIILTMNEEENLPDALASVKDWAEEVFVVDSLSVDKTVGIALERGARVVQRPFKYIGDQWRWAIERLPIKSPWILKLDADERVSDHLRREIAKLLSGNPTESGYMIKIRLWFMGKPLHAVVKTCRLWKREKGSFSDVLINEHVRVDGGIGEISGFIEHVDSPSVHRWVEKQNRYSTITSVQKMKGKAIAARANLFGSPLERQMFFKSIFYNVPFRYQIQWLHDAFVRRAILDGRIGLHWIYLRIWVRKIAELKMQEMRNNGTIPDIPVEPSGDYDPRVVDSPLQKLVSENNTL